MLACHSCHRHYRAEDACCPFCGTALHTISAPGLGMTAALAIGLSVFACTDDGDTGSADYGGPNDTDFDTETGTDTADATEDSGGADYGGPDSDSSDSGSSDTGTDGE